jgi:uroporphyrinogen III methyltransferase/synthase
MGGANIAGIARKLIAAGRPEDTPVALAYNVSLPSQKTWYTSLKELQHSLIAYPTPVLILVGEVVALAYQRNKSKTLITGTSCETYATGTDIVHTPLIKIDPIPDNRRLQAAICELSAFDWIIFTSRYGVRYFFDALREWKTDIRALANTRFASVGKTTTAELNNYQIYPDFEPETEAAEAIVAWFREQGPRGQRILLPRSDIGLKYLSEELEKLGNRITDIPVYRNTPNVEAEKADLSAFRKILFSSPSGIDAFMQLYGELPTGIQLVAKGKTTEDKLKENIHATI